MNYFDTDDCHLCCWKLQNQRYLEWKVAMVIQNCSARPMGSSNFSLTEGNWDCQTRVALESLLSQGYLNFAMIFALFEFRLIWIWQISTMYYILLYFVPLTVYTWYCYEVYVGGRHEVEERVVFSNFFIINIFIISTTKIFW